MVRLKGFLSFVFVLALTSVFFTNTSHASRQEAAREYQRVYDNAKFGKPLEELWQQLAEQVPGHEEDDKIIIFGPDVRIVLSRIIPEIDKYMQYIIDHIDDIKVIRHEKGLQVKINLTEDNVTIPIKDIDDTPKGGLYKVKLEDEISFTLSMWKDNIAVFNIYGFKFMIKLPYLPDTVYPMSIDLNGSTQILTVTAQALYKQVSVVGKVDVRNKEFDGIDWKKTLWKNFPKIIKLILLIV